MAVTKNPTTLTDDMVVMARIGAPFGIKGWLKLQTFTEYADSLDEFDHWFISSPKGWEEVAVEDYAVNVKAVVAKLQGCNDRSAAERMQKREIAIPRDWLEVAEEGAYYWIDLIGATVVNEVGERLGKIETLMETGANDVLVVKSGSTEILIPFVDAYLLNVDRDKKIVTVRWEKSWGNDAATDKIAAGSPEEA
ncbi:MAG: ribosome maturation factor RimM [Pseudomonadota bacterium]